MPLIEWSEKITLGIGEFDEHHRELIDIINRLEEALHEADHVVIVSDLLKELLGYCSYHFRAEEQFMRSIGFDGYLSHVREHKIFTDEIRRYTEDFFSGSLVVTSLLSLLQTWLVNHICTVDREYAEFARNKGILKSET